MDRSLAAPCLVAAWLFLAGVRGGLQLFSVLPPHEGLKCVVGNGFTATIGAVAETTSFTMEYHIAIDSLYGKRNFVINRMMKTTKRNVIF